MGLNGLFGIASFLPNFYVISMSTGQSSSGITMNIIRFITLFIYNRPNKKVEKIFLETLIYYFVSCLICLISLIFCFIIYKDKYFISKFKESGQISEEEIPSANKSLISISEGNNIVKYFP